jgi:aminomethyltransferase
MALRTPLYDRHTALGARMVEFGGYDMPLQYTGIREEHVAVRERAGLFDVSHMGEVLIRGDKAEAAVQRLVTNDVARLESWQAMYSVMCTEDGGVVDDLLVYRGLGGDHFLIVVNAATRMKDVSWMLEHLLDGAELLECSDEVALLALQGPRAAAILQPIAELDDGTALETLRPFHSSGARLAGIDDPRVSIVSRTGYTGEDGFELFIDATRAVRLWDALLEAGADDGLLPAGLGARDTLRLEAGLRLYGQDMDESVDPYSAGLGWTVKLDKGDFIGGQALRRIRETGPPRETIGLRLQGRSIARHGQAVLVDGRRVGEVTSGTYGFTVGCGIATALVNAGSVAGRIAVEVDIRGTPAAADIVPLPFYRRSRETR